MQTNYTAHHVPKMSRFCFIAKNPAAKNSHLHDLCRIGTKPSIHGRLTNNMHRVNASMIPNGVLPYGVQAANARFRVAPARTIEVRHKAGRRPRIDGEHLKPARLPSSFFYCLSAFAERPHSSLTTIPLCFLSRNSSCLRLPLKLPPSLHSPRPNPCVAQP